MKIVRVVAALALALSASLVPASPSGAEALGTVEFSGIASLPKFPCPVPIGQPGCQGTFAGTTTGGIGGVHDGNAWTLTLANAPMTATYAYADAVQDCTIGIANGSATITAGAFQAFGTYDAAPLPATVSEAKATLEFGWLRVGTTASIQVFNVDLQLKVNLPGGPTWINVSEDGSGRAAAAFIPEVDIDDLPDCQTFDNSPALDAVVRGTAALDQV